MDSYAASCDACISIKGKPDKLQTDQTRVRDREIPVLSLSGEDEDDGLKSIARSYMIPTVGRFSLEK